ncbi:hypothetical protein V6N11_004450 [Hibiscus sabdariffa]|uniref:Uncharacterized protein n=1 Tax=Hibiscus sabdariffa TaxID=183260 RepID=A0ABR2SG59_9ROSI
MNATFGVRLPKNLTTFGRCTIAARRISSRSSVTGCHMLSLSRGTPIEGFDFKEELRGRCGGKEGKPKLHKMYEYGELIDGGENLLSRGKQEEVEPSETNNLNVKVPSTTTKEAIDNRNNEDIVIWSFLLMRE